MPSISAIIVMACFTIALPACQKFEEWRSGGDAGEGQTSESQHGEASHSESQHGEGEHGEGEHAQHKIVVTSPIAKDVVTTKRYVCQIHSCRHIEVCALEGGYLEKILVKEGQTVKEGELIFKILPVLYQARLDSDVAEAQLAEIELQNTERLLLQKIVAPPEVALAKAKLAKAQAKVNLAKAEMAFADIKAPFDGIVDKQYQQQGSLIAEGDILTTLSDNSVMWVYFNVPETPYLEYQESPKEDLKVELMLANHQLFPQDGVIGAIEADFNNENGNIKFRADFPNPERLLRNGQTGTIRLSHVVKNALVIPQRAKFEILAKTYVYVVGDDDVVHQREITIKKEMDDIYLIESGIDVNDKILFEGLRQVRDGEKVEYEYRAPEEILEHLKFHAE
ncbi:MAG: efflux RND transporter periplasmic adaptor subunit [Aureliella sp.]